MTAALSLYCRLCAEQRLIHELIDLTSNFKFRKEIVNKLSIFSSNLIDFSVKTLPETVCIHCIQLLNSTYEFFTKIKMSQLDLTHLTSLVLKTEPQDSDHGQPDPIQPQHPQPDPIEPQHPPKHPKKFPNSKKESCVSKSKTEANDDNIEFKISFDGYNVKRTHCTKQRNSEPAVSWSTYPWTCAHCNMQVQHLGTLRRHSKGCHDVCFAMKCVDCTDDFFVDDFDSFVEHVREHRKELIDFCQHCNKKLEPDTIADHVMTHEKQLHCSYCGEFFADDFTLHYHLSHYQKFNANDVSWTDCQWKCKECSMKFTDQDSLRKHTKEVHQKCFAMQCPDCPEVADSFNAYVEHAIAHKPTLKYYCQYCNFEYSESTQPIFHLVDHVYNQCEKCGESFTSPSSLRSHVDAYKQAKIKKSTTEEELNCEICQKLFKNFASLKSHKLQHTDRQRDHVCDRCGKGFYTTKGLNSHKVIHENPEPQVCEICKKGFLTITRLKNHVRTHYTERKFQCDDCKKTFKFKAQLKNHMACHSDVMRYSCKYCEKTFRHTSVYKTHQRLHTGDRPYSCRVCGMEFANWSNCNKHMLRRHGATIAKGVLTPQGKAPINPKTGKPKKLDPELVKDWTDQLLRKRGKKK